MKKRSSSSVPSSVNHRSRSLRGSAAIAGLLSAVSAVSSANAATQTWSGTASGAWDTSALNWDGGAAAWTNTNDALFSGTPVNNVSTGTGLTIGTITLDNTFTGIVKLTGDNTVSGATTISGGTLTVTKPGTTTGTVTAADLGTSAITVNNGGTLYIDDEGNGTTGAERILNFGNNISGAGALQARASSLMTNGWSSVNFTGDLSGFTGTLDVLAGTTANRGKVKFTTGNTQAKVLSSSATVNVANGAQLYLTEALNYGFAIKLNGGTGGEGNGSLRLETAGVNVTGAVTLQADSRISGAGTISGAIGQSGGTYSLTKVGNNITVLSGNNTYGGGTTVSAGTVSVGHNSALGSGTVTMGGGNLSNTTAVTLANNFTLNNGTTFTAGSGTMVLNGNVTGSPAGSWTLTPTNKITLAGTNNLTMSANFGGLLINAGSVDITGSTTISGAAANQQSGYMNVIGTSTVAIKSGGSLTINGTTNATPPTGIIGQNAAGTSTLSVESGGTLNYGGNVGLALGNNINAAIGVLEVSGNATITAGSTTATDVRSFIMLGRDTATGTVNLNTGGVLATGRNFIRDGSGGADASGAANFNFKGGTLKALANQTDWLNSSTKNTNQLALTSVTVPTTSTIDSNGFSVAINNNISGAGGFTIISSSGSGTVTFGGGNTYTGATTVNSGTLALGASGSISSSSSVSLAAGATLNTAAQATFTMLSAQPFTFTLDPAGAGSAGLLAAAGLDITNGAVTFSTLATLNDTAYVIASYSSLTGTAFSSVTSLPSGYMLNYNYLGGNVIALVAVPEPHEYAVAIAALLGAMIFIRRRKLQA
jgi:autotransporter-associated beta strand protein